MIRGFEEIERRIWEEEKLFLMKQIGILLIRNDAIKFGDYTLVSGKKTPYYIDLRQTISSPITMDWIANSSCRIILNEIRREKIDRILGVPTAGVPFATVVSQNLGIPLIYYRQDFLFKISDAMAWLHSVGLIEDKTYEILKKYIEEEERQFSQTIPKPPQA